MFRLYKSIWTYVILLASGFTNPVMCQTAEVVRITSDSVYFNDGTVSSLFAAVPDEKSTTFFLVRHAEKASGDNPGLTYQGQERAVNLATILRSVGVNRIYSTDYKRTIATAEPLANYLRIPVEKYLSGDIERVAKTFLQNHAGEKILVVGHSNTTPDLFNALVENELLDHFADPDYGNLLIVRVASNDQTNYLKLRF
jgi:broad specificity phosphatase PhoE